MKNKLNETEMKRMNGFSELADDLEKKGYKRKELTVEAKSINLKAIAVAAPFALLAGALFYLKNGFHLDFNGCNPMLLFVAMNVAMVGLMVVHELIHGLVWGSFSEGKFKDIEFGFSREAYCLYCTCKKPLKKAAYMLGGFMPCLVLGIIPCVIAVFNGSILLLMTGIVMILGAGGDLMVLKRILAYKGCSEKTIFMDHPTKIGCMAFE